MNKEIIKGIIYKIECLPTKKIYIGQTRTHYRRGKGFIEFSAEKRWQSHVKESKQFDKKNQSGVLNAAINKYGVDQFTIETITYCDLEDNNDLEKFYIKEYNSLAPNGYNLTSGGKQGMILAEEVRDKLSMSGKKYFSNTENKISKSIVTQNYSINNIIDKFANINIKLIEINPIKNNGDYKINYLYITDDQDKISRVRIGGKFINYEDSLNRTINIGKQLLQGDLSKLKISTLISDKDNELSRYSDKIELYKNKNIIKIQLKKHKHTHNYVVSVFLTLPETMSWKDKVKIVFGGKNIEFVDAHKIAMQFIEQIKNDNTIIENDI